MGQVSTIYLPVLDILSFCPTHFSPVFQPILYKFIVLGFFGLSLFFLGWPPNLVLTIGAVCGNTGVTVSLTINNGSFRFFCVQLMKPFGMRWMLDGLSRRLLNPHGIRQLLQQLTLTIKFWMQFFVVFLQMSSTGYLTSYCQGGVADIGDHVWRNKES